MDDLSLVGNSLAFDPLVPEKHVRLLLMIADQRLTRIVHSCRKMICTKFYQRRCHRRTLYALLQVGTTGIKHGFPQEWQDD